MYYADRNGLHFLYAHESSYILVQREARFVKSNSHKKLYSIDKFARKFYCGHARLGQLRSEKHLAKVAARRSNKREIKEQREE